MRAPLVVCMGVSGSGKSTSAAVLARELDLPILEADDFHSIESKQKMRSGIPLSDRDRTPWMARVCKEISALKTEGCVIAHSALKRKHRDQLRALGMPTIFVHLQARQNIIRERMEAREGHFMPAELLDSQYASLEHTDAEADVIQLDASQDQEALEKVIMVYANKIRTRASCA